MSAAKKEPASERRIRAGKTNVWRRALDAVAGNDGDIGLDTLARLKTELWVLSTALRNDDMPLDQRDAADVIGQMVARIDLALELAHEESEAQ